MHRDPTCAADAVRFGAKPSQVQAPSVLLSTCICGHVRAAGRPGINLKPLQLPRHLQVSTLILTIRTRRLISSGCAGWPWDITVLRCRAVAQTGLTDMLSLNGSTAMMVERLQLPELRKEQPHHHLNLVQGTLRLSARQ